MKHGLSPEEFEKQRQEGVKRASLLNRLAIDWRERVKTSGISPGELHDVLGELTYDDGKPLTKAHIAAIVNYCYYQQDTEVLRNLMAKGRGATRRAGIYL